MHQQNRFRTSTLLLASILSFALLVLMMGCGPAPEEGAGEDASQSEQERTEPAVPDQPAVPEDDGPAVPDQEGAADATEADGPAVPPQESDQEAAAPETSEAESSLVLHLTMDDNTDSDVVTDATGNHTVKLNKHAPEPTSGYSAEGAIGRAFSFVGKEYGIKTGKSMLDQYLGQGQDFTITFWWKTTTDPIEKPENVIRRWTGEYADPGLSIFHYPDTDRLGVRLILNEDLYVTANFENVNDGKFHHYAIIRKGETLIIMRDGETARRFTDSSVTAPIGEKQSLTIGPAQGAVDDFRIYNEAISEQKVRKLYQLF